MTGPPRKSTGTGRRSMPPKRTDERAAENVFEQAPSAFTEKETVGSERNLFKEQTMAAKKALVIGIDDYGGPPNDLACCVKDADAFARILQSSYGFDEVHALRDGDATLEKTDEELRWLFKGRKRDDRVVLYFSGHGFTRTRDGVVEECLALRNGLFESERLLATASDLPPGIFTAVLDTAFSGPLEQFVADGAGAVPGVEVTHAKVWWPSPNEAALRDRAEREQRVTEFKRFLCHPISSAAGLVNALTLRTHTPLAASAMRSTASPIGGRSAVADEGQLALNGLMLCASTEADSAAATTSRTDGHSAFTFALLTALTKVGAQASTAEVIAASTAQLRALGFQQTPQLVEHAAAGDFKLRRLFSLEPISAAETLRVMSEPRYWEGVLTAATRPFSSAWAVNQEINHMTMQQPIPSAYQPTLAAFQQPFATQYQQPFGIGQPASDDLNRTISAIGPALATVIPAIVPQIVNGVLAQQRFASPGSYGPSFATATPFGYAGISPLGGASHPVATSEDVQRLLPVLTPILSSVIPAVVPQLVNNILAQQRAMSSQWGTPQGSLDAWGAAPIGFQNPYGLR